jgi:hypothetical protein
MGTSHFMRKFNGSIYKKGDKPWPLPNRLNLPSTSDLNSRDPLKRARAAESEDDHMPTENLSDLLDQVSKNSTGGIDGLIGDLERLRGKLQTDGERIQREIEEYRRLSQLVMQLTKGISENVEKVRASADRPSRVTQETE